MCFPTASPPQKPLTSSVRLVWCLRSLSGLAASGLQLDKYGLLQLSSPNLADVLSTLLGVVLVLRAYVRSTVRGDSVGWPARCCPGQTDRGVGCHTSALHTS